MAAPSLGIVGTKITCHFPLSGGKAEFVAVTQAVQEAIYLREKLPDIDFPQTSATLLYEDNLVCVTMSEAKIRCAESSPVISIFVSTMCVNSS